MIALFYLFIGVLFLLFCLLFWVIIKRNMHLWLPNYCLNKITKKPCLTNGHIHILFCFVDHFEPGWNKAGLVLQRKRLDGWLEKYPRFARKFIDTDGFHPRHTWFYPPHYFREEHILKLLSLCKKNFGEIEMHLHHSRMTPFPDTSESLKNKIRQCIELYSKYGIFETSINGEHVIRYAFIHGDWALDNSRHRYCGVNDEITILKETGCYADFTFPAYLMESQPKIINSIYYAKDDPKSPKSYNTGKRVEAGSFEEEGSLLMIQGPLSLRWKNRKRLILPSIDDGEISDNNPPCRERVDTWVKAGVHVLGRPDWLIIKVFAHGASLKEQTVILNKPIEQMHSYLQEKYNDGSKYFLHYVTARELYNIIKAAESGYTGNPGYYRDYIIKPYYYHDCKSANNKSSIKGNNGGI